jgi:nucleoside phosphorylase
MVIKLPARRNKTSHNRPIVVVTALQEEADALERVLIYASFQRSQSNALSQFYHKIFYKRESDGFDIECIVITADRIGKLEAAVATSLACYHFNPSFVFVVGIAGGLQNNDSIRNPKLGDVIVAEKIYDIDLRKIYGPEEIHIRTNVYVAPQEVIFLIREIAGDSVNAHENEWYRSIPREVRGSVKPNIIIGSMVSGDGVIAAGSDRMIARLAISEYFSGGEPMARPEPPIGVEMEGAGVVIGASRAAPGVDVLMIKGVSDFANREKFDDSRVGRQLARYSSAALLLELIKSRKFRSIMSKNKVL